MVPFCAVTGAPERGVLQNLPRYTLTMGDRPVAARYIAIGALPLKDIQRRLRLIIHTQLGNGCSVTQAGSRA
jgi:hypothetical protein